MTTKLSNQVREFMTAFGQTVKTKPEVPDDATIRLRLRLIAEEFIELVSACGSSSSSDQTGEVYSHIDDAEEVLNDLIRALHIRVSMHEVADALADLDYVVEGARLAFGIDGEPIADEVHAANMRKVGGYTDEHGKYRKPSGWVGPDIIGRLREQGWSE